MGYIRVRNVGKAYKRYTHKWGRVAEWLGSGRHHQLKWVFRDLSFDIAAGEAVGIIGFNGAGKSTLLKIISGTTRATAGNVEVGGRASALLELGIGFHPEFTGRENAYMAGQLRGLGKDELDSRMPEIESFADIGDYIDQPLRVYSSGMQVRLAFSVATVVRPEILIVDEALAVGDVLFQQKCFDRIRGFCAAGTTLLFVSHSLGAVYSLCDRALLIHEGQIAADGPPRQAIDLYNALTLRASDPRRGDIVIAGERRASTGETALAPDPSAPMAAGERAVDVAAPADDTETRAPVATGSYATGDVHIVSVDLRQQEQPVEAFISESDIAVVVRARFEREFDDPHVGFQVRNARGEPVFMTNTHCMGLRIGSVRTGDEVTVRFAFQASFAPGDYSLTAGVANRGLPEGMFDEALIRAQDIRSFSVLRNFASILWSGVYNVAPTCQIQRSDA